MNGKHQLPVYADDANMLGENLQTVREYAEIFIKASKDIGLEVNSVKTKYMITSRHKNVIQNQNIAIGNLSYENVETFRYLGVTVTNTKDIREEIKRRINMGNACYYSLQKILSPWLLSKKLKISTYYRLYCTVVKLCHLEREHRLRVFENKVLRKIFGAKRDEITGEWEGYIMLSYMHCILRLI